MVVMVPDTPRDVMKIEHTVVRPKLVCPFLQARKKEMMQTLQEAGSEVTVPGT